MSENPSTDVIHRILRKAGTVAIVGLSPRPERDSHHVAEELQRFGLRIVPVRPGGGTILGETVWPSLSAIPPESLKEIDIVDVFLAPDRVDGIVEECLELGLTGRTLWLQLGVTNEAAANRARAAGMTVVMDRCLYVDYRQLPGKP